MRNLSLFSFSAIFALIVTLILQGCLSDEISTDPQFSVEFSQDTLRFDTVFTTIGSATRSFRILNKNDQDVSISSIRLSNGSETMFRLNVDGLPGQAFTDIRVPANDSIWVFAEVTVNPDQPVSLSPFVIEDQFLATVNGNEEFVQLEAFGQNANYITSASNIGESIAIPCELGSLTWDDPKPYIIYGVVGIQNCDVTIAPGTRIHVHGGIVQDDGTFRNDGIIVVDVNGSIRAQGSLEEPIIFQGDRLEEQFQEAAGQWGGLIFAPGSDPSTFNHVQIKNSIVGIRADSSSNVRISNSKIFNTAGSGIIGRFANITAQNTLIHSNNIRCLEVTFGGTYNFEHCTLANYLNSDEAVLLANFTCRNEDCTLIEERTLNATFENCVITGNDTDEIILADGDGNTSNFRYTFSNSAIQVDELLGTDQFSDLLTAHCDDCFVINRGDTLFRDESQFDFHPDTLSTLIDKALFNSALPIDLDGVDRTPGNTDIGCYEFVPEM